jgi:NAD(P)-dependent dehydrogenase (short-subunit alcohol dehydrogenase family)
LRRLAVEVVLLNQRGLVVAESRPFVASGPNAAPDIFSLHDKVAIVTGALGLLGKNHCWALASAGATVIAADLDESACDEFAARISDRYATPSHGIKVDITDPAAIESLRNEVLATFGRIDVLVNNAAVNDVFAEAQFQILKLENYPLELWKRFIDVNLTGTFLCSQILGSEMAKRKSGSIINIASTYGVVAPDQSVYRRPDGEQSFYKSPVYPAAKAGIIALTKYMASYWGRSGVRVNALSPGGVENLQDDFFVKNYSARTPLGRMAMPDEYRGAIVFLASDAASYMTGANLIIDGGWTAW